MAGLEQLLIVYLPLIQALHDDDLDAAAFFLDVAARTERTVDGADLRTGRALLPPDVVLLLEECGLERQLAAVGAALEQIEGVQHAV